MLIALRNKRTLAAATSGGVVAIATLLGTGVCAADSNWTITVKNGGKVAADVTILCDSKPAGNKASAVRPDGTAMIAIPATNPACKGKYSWKAEYAGKVCGSHSVDISGSTTLSVTCDAAPPASAASQPGSGTSSPPPAPANLRLKSTEDMEKEIDAIQKDIVTITDQLDKVDSKQKLDVLQKQVDKDREAVYRISTVLNGVPRSVIETNPSDWSTLKQKTTDTGSRIEKVLKRILGCVPSGDVVGSDGAGSGATKIDDGTKGKHVIGCKRDI